MNRPLAALAVLALPLAAPAASLPDHVVKRVSSACVLIQVAEGGKGSMGSGFFVSRNDIVTNHHVVKAAAEGGAQVAVVIERGPGRREVAEAAVVASDEELDLALLRTEESARHSLRFLPDRSLKLTQTVFVAGYPFGTRPGLELTVTTGTISSLRHDPEGDLRLVQIDAAVNPGNSGGPVVDERGRVVGVSRATIDPKVGTGIAIAIPSGVVEKFVDVASRVRRRSATLRLRGKSSRDGLRVLGAEKTEETWGTSIRLSVRGKRGAGEALPFLVEITDRRRQVLQRDAVVLAGLRQGEERTYTIRLRGVDFHDVAACQIVD
ncbi:MAG: S1C family serine protease [Candidatus Brocadiia bacterium]